MNEDQLLICRGQHLWLSPERTVFWEEEKTMILSDTHFGKTGHFRKNGIAIPQTIYKEDLLRFFSIIQFYKAQRVLVVGDFFHSHVNEELDWFLKWKRDFSQLQITMVKGNHDILPASWYEAAAIEIIQETLLSGPFQFQHDYDEKAQKNKNNIEQATDTNHPAYIFSGHIHPGITIKGLSKQSLRLPCFYFGKHHCILPAFSKFSGLATIKPKKEDQIFAIVNNQLIQTK
ncbi:ligase-associated DNA damage response endonuclease PdeM [Sediminibacterium salmoneum]|uniref:ligase-associated DNA damage response endonuclease PdeM n=1 Tax=Sediminibacterium salmoneum TaxID=426421 RepID=UPI000478ED8C|nr:ligase-associated DNA damage response endonuclease PdeM [Sediminibacterium salmoneum]